MRRLICAFVVRILHKTHFLMARLILDNIYRRAKTYYIWDISASSWENVSSGVSDQVRHKPTCSTTKTSQSLEISAIESRDIILSMQQTTKALITLSAPLLFAYDIRHIFSWPGSIITSKVQGGVALWLWHSLDFSINFFHQTWEQMLVN